jgi:hypothetical protein
MPDERAPGYARISGPVERQQPDLVPAQAGGQVAEHDVPAAV